MTTLTTTDDNDHRPALPRGRLIFTLDATATARRHGRSRAISKPRCSAKQRGTSTCSSSITGATNAEHKARKRMAEMLKRTGFPDSPSPSQIEHWERDMLPPLTPWDRHLAARAIVRCGITNLDAIVDYFVGMAHAVLNPNAVAVMDAQ
jgi:hypothetical protein